MLQRSRSFDFASLELRLALEAMLLRSRLFGLASLLQLLLLEKPPQPFEKPVFLILSSQRSRLIEFNLLLVLYFWLFMLLSVQSRSFGFELLLALEALLFMLLLFGRPPPQSFEKLLFLLLLER